MIIFHIIIHPTVHIYDFYLFITSSSSFHGFIRNQFNHMLAVGLLTHLVVRALHRYRRGQGFESLTTLNFFFRFSFPSCKNCVYNCDDHLSHDCFSEYFQLGFCFVINSRPNWRVRQCYHLMKCNGPKHI